MRDCPDLTPTQLADFYRAVGGNYDVLFVETQPSSISFIYKALGCLHSIQPRDETDGHATPCIPALKSKGFVTWQTIQLLLGPEEHVPFLQNAVAQFDIVDPVTGEVFPKILPEEAFPREPDPAMLKWYDQVHDKLQQDLQQSPQANRPSTALSVEDASFSEQSGDERFAASYFRNPMFRDTTGRPTVTANRPSHKPTRMKASRQPSIADRGKAIVNNVRHFISPPSTSHHHSSPRYSRRGSHPDRLREDTEEEDDREYEDLTPTADFYPEYRDKPPAISRTRPKSPELIETDSDSDGVRVTKRPSATRRTSSRDQREREARERESRERSIHRDMEHIRRERERERDRERVYERDSPVSGSHSSKSPPLRHRRSHEPQVSPVDYFHRPFFTNEEGGRRHSHTHGPSYAGPEVGGFAPSNEPSMASRVAKMQHSRERAGSPRSGNGSGSGGSYPPRSVPGVEERQGNYNGRPTVRYSRRSIDEERKRERERDRPRYERGSRGSDEYLAEPLRVDLQAVRSRSQEKWDPERLRQSTRYVEGASGRRYPSTVPWR